MNHMREAFSPEKKRLVGEGTWRSRYTLKDPGRQTRTMTRGF